MHECRLLKIFSISRSWKVHFVDFRKVFDTVDHDILLKKLQHYGVRRIQIDYSGHSSKRESVCFSRKLYIQYKKISLVYHKFQFLVLFCFSYTQMSSTNVSKIVKPTFLQMAQILLSLANIYKHKQNNSRSKKSIPLASCKEV